MSTIFNFTFQPKFLTKEERAQEALKRRQEQVDDLRKRRDEERNKRVNFERQAEDSRKTDRDRDREIRRRERERDQRQRERDREDRIREREGKGKDKDSKDGKEDRHRASTVEVSYIANT